MFCNIHVHVHTVHVHIATGTLYTNIYIHVYVQYTCADKIYMYMYTVCVYMYIHLYLNISVHILYMYTVYCIYNVHVHCTLNDLPCIIIAALSTGPLLKEVKFHSTDVAVAVQIDPMEHLLQCLLTCLRQRDLSFFSRTNQWRLFLYRLLSRLEVTARCKGNESVGPSIQV